MACYHLCVKAIMSNHVICLHRLNFTALFLVLHLTFINFAK